MADQDQSDDELEGEPEGVVLDLRRFDDDTFAIIVRNPEVGEGEPSGFWVQLSRANLQDLLERGAAMLDVTTEPPLSTGEALQQLEHVAEQERRRRRGMN